MTPMLAGLLMIVLAVIGSAVTKVLCDAEDRRMIREAEAGQQVESWVLWAQGLATLAAAFASLCLLIIGFGLMFVGMLHP